MKDYKLTEDVLYAYQYPRASVTADAVLFAERDGQIYVLLIQRGNDPNVVAQAYKNVLPEFSHHFRTIEFAVYCRPNDDSNYHAFKEIMKV